jgi:hypothetical protein
MNCPFLDVVSVYGVRLPFVPVAVSGVFLAEKLNAFLGQNWKSFSSQNYFDPQGLFISVMWSGPLLVITILILVSASSAVSFFVSLCTPFCFSLLATVLCALVLQVNTLVTLCMLMVRWKRAELKHRAREARSKQE